MNPIYVQYVLDDYKRRTTNDDLQEYMFPVAPPNHANSIMQRVGRSIRSIIDATASAWRGGQATKLRLPRFADDAAQRS